MELGGWGRLLVPGCELWWRGGVGEEECGVQEVCPGCKQSPPAAAAEVLEVAVAGALPEITASTGRSRGDPP